jgi:phosphoribosylaminoimidazole-succinocarboxamide synthase
MPKHKFTPVKGEPHPKLDRTVIYRAHGVRLDLAMWIPYAKEAVPLMDEILKRVSVLRKSIEAAGLWMNDFEQKWGMLAEVSIFLHDQTRERDRLHRYWDKKTREFRQGWQKGRDPLDEYYVTVSFLDYKDEKGLPPGKIRSMIIWFHHQEEKAPLGNLAYVSQHFIF